MKKFILFFVVVPSITLSSCLQIGKMAASLMTEKTTSIKNAVLTLVYTNNLYTPATKTTSLDYVGDKWQEGKSALTLVLQKKKGVGLYEVLGDVSVNNTPLPYIGIGSYTKFMDELENKTQTVNIKTKTGEETSISVEPPKPVKIVAINGNKENPEIDLSSDIELEMEDFKELDKEERLKASLIMDVLGVREFVDMGIFKPAKKIKIPNAALKNLSVSASASGVAELKAGKNYFRIERYKLKKERIPTVAASQVISASWSTMPVTLKGNSIQNMGCKIEGMTKDKEGKDDFRYNFYKPNAFAGKPLIKAKKFALIALSVRGGLYHSETNTSQSTAGGITTTTTTTTTRQFPQLPDIFWEQLLNNTYKDIVKMLKELNIELIPVEKTLQAKEYSNISDEVYEKNDYREIVKTYKGTRNLMPSSFIKMVGDISSTIASDRPDVRLQNELGVDGLIGVSIDLLIDRKSEQIKLIPNLSVKMVGGTNGYSVGPVIYTTGHISGKGLPFSQSEFSNVNALNRITRKDEMMVLLKKSIKDLENQAKEKGYNDIWNLQ